MLNVLVPIIEDADKFEKFIVENAGRGVKFIVGIRENLSINLPKSVKLFKFPKNSKREEILNALKDVPILYGKVLIARRPLSKGEFQKITSSEKDIAVFNTEKNRFVRGWNRFISKLIKKIFAFNFFNDISAICYSQSMFDLLSVCQNISLVSRINNFVGVEIDYITPEKKAVKKERNKVACALKFSAWILFFLASIAAVVCISLFTKPIIFVIMAEILLLFISTTLLIISIFNFSRSIAVGDLRFGKAEKIG